MKRVTNVLLLLVLVRVGGGSVQAQNQPTSFVPLDGLAGALKSDVPGVAALADKKAEIASLLQEHTQELAVYALGAAVYTSLVEEERIDKQIGGSGANAGSTGLVSHGSVPALIGVAVESGALYQSVSGNIVTFRLNPSGLARALAKHAYLVSGPPVNTTVFEEGLNRLSASASLDFSEGSLPGTFTGKRSQLKEAAVRFDILNKRDPRHPSHAGAIRQLRGEMAPLVNSLTAYFDILKKMPGYDSWRVEAADRLAAVNLQDDGALQAALFAVADEFASMFASDPDLKTLAQRMVKGIKSQHEVRDKVFESISKSSVLTFEYAFNKLTIPDTAVASLPSGAVVPDLSTARLIFSSPLGTAGEATLNGSITFFNSTASQMRGNLRDVQVAGSLDLRLPELQGIGRPVLTLAGLGVFLHQQPFGTKVTVQNVETADGWIGVFQSKLTFPAGESGVRIPVSLTFSNRSEFNTERDVRGSIGLTFDLDKVFAR